MIFQKNNSHQNDSLWSLANLSCVLHLIEISPLHMQTTRSLVSPSPPYRGWQTCHDSSLLSWLSVWRDLHSSICKLVSKTDLSRRVGRKVVRVWRPESRTVREIYLEVYIQWRRKPFVRRFLEAPATISLVNEWWDWYRDRTHDRRSGLFDVTFRREVVIVCVLHELWQRHDRSPRSVFEMIV